MTSYPPHFRAVTDGTREVMEISDGHGRLRYISIHTLLDLAYEAEYHALSETAEEAKQPLCSICRAHHGREVKHVHE